MLSCYETHLNMYLILVLTQAALMCLSSHIFDCCGVQPKIKSDGQTVGIMDFVVTGAIALVVAISNYNILNETYAT